MPGKIVLALLLATVTVTGTALAAQTIQVDKANRTIAVNVTDSATALADTAILHLGFTVYAATSDDGYAQASKTSNAIAAALAAAGIARDRLESDQQSLTETPLFELQQLPAEERAAHRFQLEQTWTIRLSPDQAAKVLNIAVQAGANQSGHIDWSVADENALEAHAAAKAMARGKEIAEAMAKGLGATLGPLLYASNEAPAPAIRPLHAMAERLTGGGGAVAPTAPLSINPRRVERSATVYAIFAIE
jgi:uncharacterized protein